MGPRPFGGSAHIRGHGGPQFYPVREDPATTPQDLDASILGFLEGLGEFRVDPAGCPNLSGIGPLEDKENRGIPSILPNDFSQLPDMSRPTGRHRIRKEGHSALHEGHALHLQGKSVPGFPAEKEVQPGSSHGYLGSLQSPATELLHNPQLQPLLDEAIREGGIQADQSPGIGCFHEDSRPAGLPVWIVGGSQPDPFLWKEKLPQPSWIRHVSLDLTAGILKSDLENKAIQTLDETGLDQRARNWRGDVLCTDRRGQVP